jgi:hypothetical protein
MNPLRIALPALLVVALAAGAVIATRPAEQNARQPLPATPGAAPVELVFAQPFALDLPYEHTWRAEAPEVASGWILVLRADPALLARRQTAEPVLYVESETAERVNNGDGGNLVVLVPSPVGPSGIPVLDPFQARIWFGTPELPERIDASRIASELALAIQAGVGPAAAASLLAPAPLGTAFAVDRAELDVYLADLIELYSPGETALVAGMRIPIAR